MEDNTSKPIFNKASGLEKSKIHRNYSDKEMIELIGRYASVAKTDEKKNVMLGIKDDYLETKENRVAAQLTKDQHYRNGIAAGLHRRETLENLDNQEKELDQRDRNRAVEKAKQYYHRNYSLTKVHKDAIKPKERTKGMVKE